MIAVGCGFYAFTDEELQAKLNILKSKYKDYNIDSLRVEEVSLFFYSVVMYITKKEEIDIDQFNISGDCRGAILECMRGGAVNSASRCGKNSSTSCQGVN